MGRGFYQSLCHPGLVLGFECGHGRVGFWFGFRNVVGSTASDGNEVVDISTKYQSESFRTKLISAYSLKTGTIKIQL